MKKTAFAILMTIMFLVGRGEARQWSFPNGGDPKVRLAHDPYFSFPDGFKATVRFQIDLSTINPRSGFANLFCKGKDFNYGYSVMVKRDGRILVDLLGIEPSYYITSKKIQSGKPTTLEFYVDKKSVRIFFDGIESNSYLYYMGRPDFSNHDPFYIGSMGGYSFTGSMSYFEIIPLAEVEKLPAGKLKSLVTETPKHQKRAEILWTKAICVEEDRYIGWPTVCRLQNGEIIAVFSGDRDAHVCPWGKVQLVRSKDNGDTWSAPQTIANGPIDDRDAGIVQLPDGKILVTYFTSIAYRTTNFLKTKWPKSSLKYWWRRHDEKLSDAVRKSALGYYRITSEDNGITWSAPEKMRSVSHTPHGPILLRDGSLLQLGRTFSQAKLGTTEAGKTIISAWKSTDGARTWSCLCPEVPDQNGENDQPHMFHEPHVVELPDGKLIGLVRYHGEDNCLRQTESLDGGKTWTPMRKTGMLGLPPHLLRLHDGKLVAVYGRRFSDPGYGEFAAISDDNGKTWDVENEIMLRHCHCGDLGYPSSCLLPDGDILTVYYQPEKIGVLPCLMATKWRVIE